jgi:predicted methyltransferase
MTSSCIFHYIEISIILVGGNNMLHMVAEMAKAGFQQIGTIAKKLGITVQGT